MGSTPTSFRHPLLTRPSSARLNAAAGAGLGSGGPGDGGHPAKEEEVVAAKRAAVGMEEPEESFLHKVANAYAAELDGAAIRTRFGEKPGDDFQHGLAIAFGLAAGDGSG